MHLGNLNGHYNKPPLDNSWTAGLIGAAISLLVMGAFWYVQTKARSRPQTPQRLGANHHGQTPARSHIQLFSHPARQR